MPSAGSSAAQGAAAGAAFGPWGAVIGGAVGLLGGLLGKQKAPKTAPFVPTNLADEQAKALRANLDQEKSIEQLLEQANKFQQGQATSLMESAIPGWGKLQGNLTGLATEMSANPYEVPKEVEGNLARIAAERGISAGTRGQFNDFSLLRDFGVNALQYGQSRIAQAQGLAQTLAALAPRINPMSPLSFYITPQQQAAVTQANNAGMQGTNQGAYNAQTAASNYNRANTWDSMLQGAGAGYQIGKGY